MNATRVPNKCKYCGLCVRYTFLDAPGTRSNDQAFGELRVLNEQRIVRQRFPRLVGMSNTPGDFGTTEFCAVAAPAWLQNDRRCKHWSLKIEGATIADYLALHSSRDTLRQTLWVAMIALIVSSAITLAQLLR
jgi:hypothetical protein